VEEEFLENADGRKTEMLVAQGNQEVVLHALEDLMPLRKVTLIEICLSAGIKDLNVRPFEALQVLFLNHLLQGLSDEQSIPLLRRAVGAVFLCVGARDVDFFLSSRKRAHLERRGPDVLRARQEDLQILLREFGVEIHDLGEVDEANLECGLGRLLLEDGVDDAEEDRRVVVDCLLRDGLEARLEAHVRGGRLGLVTNKHSRFHAVAA